MQGRQQFTDKGALRFRLSERVPKQNLYRRLADLVDWDFLYQQTQARKEDYMTKLLTYTHEKDAANFDT